MNLIYNINVNEDIIVKRILAISLSVLIVLGIFVNNVHAAVSFVDDILPSDFPKSDSSLV